MNDPSDRLRTLCAAQRDFFRSGATLEPAFRLAMLRRLERALRRWEGPLAEALREDLHKSAEESVLTELSVVRREVRYHLSHLRRWMRPERRPTPLKLFPSRSRIERQPLGPALILAPWNYPVQLLLMPLIGAVSAGCTALLKPSPRAPRTAGTLARMIGETFEPHYVAVAEGGHGTVALLLDEPWGLIFFTGSAAAGREVMAAAARRLTPVVLELGGKSPCIVDRGADVDLAARRIAWGKTLNAGQTYVAPDYVLVHETLREGFVAAYARALERLHGPDPRRSLHYGRMVSDEAFDRVAGYLREGRILVGGACCREERYVAPTLLGDVGPDAAVMREEIFGPVLPMLLFGRIDEALDWVNAREHPLALYYFGPVRGGREVMRRTSSGGGCINDTVVHLANHHLPFGGVGGSGMGRYHGRESFETFTHRRAVVTTPRWPDPPFRYMPYRFFRWIGKIL